MTWLVTGATGLVGNNLTRRLLDQGETVRVLVREPSNPRPLAGLAVEVRLGDIRDANAVRSAVEGVTHVLHAAAYVHIGWSHKETQQAVNVLGTKNVNAAVRDIGCRMVYVSTVDTLGIGRKDQPADESTPRGGQVPCGYVMTKREAEQLVVQGTQDGLDAVIVNPGYMVGPWDWKPSSGRMILAVARRVVPFAPVGGGSMCDVRDVADAIISAARRGPTGRQYILAGHNMTYRAMWQLMVDIAGGWGPYIPAGPLMRLIGGRAGDLVTKLTGREPLINSAGVRMSSQFHYYSSARAEQELDYRVRPARESVSAAWQWLQEYGYA